jgi:hypothetical protein
MRATRERRAKDPQRTAVRRLLAATAIAVAGTAAMVAVTLPMNAAGDDNSARPQAHSSPSAARQSSPDSSAPGTYAPRAATPAHGTGDDPLTADEIARARQAALGADRTLRTTSQDVQGHDGAPQFLTADLTEGDSAGRRADVLFYNYRDDRVVRTTVDLGTGRVVHTESGTRVQPPPTGPEAREALKVLLADPLGDGVRQDFEAATGHPLSVAGQLAVRGMTYDNPPPGDAELADCDGAHRCVRLFTRLRGGPWIDTRQFVIDLSDRTVHRIP